MFGRTIRIDGKEFFVWCCPDTPLSEVLERASRQAAKEERAARDRDPDTAAYRAAIKAGLGGLSISSTQRDGAT